MLRKLTYLTSKKVKITGLMLFLLLLGGIDLQAQYFGRNKPSYQKFDFKVYQTPHFEIYHYMEDDSLLHALANSAEQWYQMHQEVFKDTFNVRNPIIFYNNHADFQQTTAINSLIGVGTGGVTEALKNRVVMPITESNAQTDHVLGHELVHAFQYKTLFKDDSISLKNMNNLPLWMVEGMAEYLSIGSIDSHTAMWMRDALLHDDFPTLQDLTRNMKYFPYRYGHAFWVFVGKVWGDDVIIPLFLETAKYGYNYALKKVLGYDEKTISNMWKSAMKEHFGKYLVSEEDSLIGKRLLFEDNAGTINISPSISPDGKYVAFYSEKGIFTLDLYLANTETGKIIKKLSSTVGNNEIDDFNFLESAGTWSPDGKQFAFVVFSKGRNKLVFVDVEKAEIINESFIPGVLAFSYPTWSPDGKSIVVSGLKTGRSDLFQFNLKTKKVKQLTFDYYSNLQPSYSPDGRYIVFVTDAPANKKSEFLQLHENIALIDLQDNSVKVLELFNGANNLNPVYSYDSKQIYFLSDCDGFRNLFMYDLDQKNVFRLTRYMTGISGISTLSPAISYAKDVDKLVYTYYRKNQYEIIAASREEFIKEELDKNKLPWTDTVMVFSSLKADPPVPEKDTTNETGIKYADESKNALYSTISQESGMLSNPAALPPYKRIAKNVVDTNLYYRSTGTIFPQDSFRIVAYKPRFKLDYISNVNVGIGTNGFGRTGMAGSIFMLFSDIVGNNQISTAFAVNGEVWDFGGYVSYFNQKRKLDWGMSLSHFPYLQVYPAYEIDTISIDGETEVAVLNNPYYSFRTFEDQLSLFIQLPLSQTQRFEFNTAIAAYYYRFEKINRYLDGYGYLFHEEKEVLDNPSGFTMQQASIAHVIDNSYFGIASPSKGMRSRVELGQYFGGIQLTNFLIDYRKYWFAKPVTFAFRLNHSGRYSKSISERLYPIYIGYPWLVRGYYGRSLYTVDDLQFAQDPYYLFGDRSLITNFEIRVPFTGPKRLALIRSGGLYTELAAFVDAGIAWDNDHVPVLKWKQDNPSERIPVVSTGLSLRINLFGMMVIEPFLAYPLQIYGFKQHVFGLNFTPGW